MKPSISRLSATLILPTALLLSQCAPIDVIQPPQVTAVEGYELHRLPVSLGGAVFQEEFQDILTDWMQSIPSENQTPLIAPTDPNNDASAESEAQFIAALVVEAYRIQAILNTDDYPTCRPDAELKSEPFFPPPAPEPDFPMKESGLQWLESLR